MLFFISNNAIQTSRKQFLMGEYSLNGLFLGIEMNQNNLGIQYIESKYCSSTTYVNLSFSNDI
ncbi:hypothetical protein J0L31_11660 [Terrisporobacter glycolicus]|nr:hypothetical protein [Terrisporobacter glycolicus]